MAVNAQDVKKLREQTGAGMMDCKKALQETGGDFKQAVRYLREKGLAEAKKRAGREAREGRIAVSSSGDGNAALMLEVNCETDFVARNPDFVEFVEDVAMQVAAMSPQYVKAEDIPDEDRAAQKEIYKAQAAQSGKPDNIVEKMIEGKLKKWAKEVCLYDQPFIRDDKKTIDQIRTALVAKTGENISVRRFVRYELGEGLEKRKSDLAAEVAAEMAKYE